MMTIRAERSALIVLCSKVLTFTGISAINSCMSNNKTVWSSEEGDLRKKEQNSANGASLPPQQQTVYLHRESSGRGGKAVTLVKHLALSANDLKTLAKKLKQECGTGGTIKDGIIEIQGE